MISCAICDRDPDEISEYSSRYKKEGYDSAEEFVMMEEGTYNPSQGVFYCTECYIKIGMPIGKATIQVKKGRKLR